MQNPIKIAHISDLHFSKITFSPLQFFSKRWVGNVNLLFYRKAVYLPQRLETLISVFKLMGITVIIISGDLTTTSREDELIAARKFVDLFTDAGFQVFVVPGNHDRYVKTDFKKKKFYRYFPPYYCEHVPLPIKYSLKDHGVTCAKIADGWWIIGMDTTMYTSLFSASGLFSEEVEKNLEGLLQSIPSTDRIILVNHFPLFPNDKWRNTLFRCRELQKITAKYPNITFYIHGHTHRNCVADLRVNGYPIILDSGSTSHQEIGSWNYLEIHPDSAKVEIFQRELVFSTNWKMIKKVSYTL